jgi:hypothetical protein
MRRATPILVLLLLSCGGQPLTGPRQVSAVAKACEASTEPLAISLEAAKGPGLEAVLSNCSAAEQVLIHDSHLQDCRLVLVDAEGKEVESFDTRMVMKFDNRPHEYLFQSLEPGDGIVLHDERFMENDEGGWEMQWGPHRFEEIGPGTYTAHVEWTCELDSWFTEETDQYETIEGIWTGAVRSNEVTLTLR